MKKITSALILVSQLFFGSSLLANTDGMAEVEENEKDRLTYGNQALS